VIEKEASIPMPKPWKPSDETARAAAPIDHFYRPATNIYRTILEERIIDFLLSPYAIVAGARALDTPIAKNILDTCITLGLPYALSENGRRLFDPVEVRNFIKYAYFKYGAPFWRDRAVFMLRRLMSETVSWMSLNIPPNLAELKPATYDITIHRTFNLAAHQIGDVIKLRLPLPIDDPATPASTSVFLSTDTPDAQTKYEQARLTVRLAVPESREVTIGVRVRLRFTPKTSNISSKLDHADSTLYTRQEEGLIKVDRRICDLSQSIIGSCVDRLDSIYRLWDFVFDELTLGSIYYDQLDQEHPLHWTLDNRIYDCKVGAALLIALCRAHGIPARMISGYTLNPVLPTTHSWFEVWFDGQGWLPFDLYSMDLCCGDKTSSWRHHFFGKIDHRLITERLPRLFSGLGSIRLPNRWQMISTRDDEGVITYFENLQTGTSIYSEKVTVMSIE
jgi:hypothetical protein